MRVVIAPDSFKGSMDASAVAAAIAVGWSSRRHRDELVLLPQADGGEGTLDAVAAAHPDAVRHQFTDVEGPDSRPTTGYWLSLADGSAIVELAQMSGLPLMATPDAGGASTIGLGQVIGAALDGGATSLVIGLGGSASTDGGAGALSSLGMRLLDSDGSDLRKGGAALADLDAVCISKLRAPPSGGVLLLNDTVAPLCGPAGAAHVFGPQKGADGAMCIRLDAALSHFASVLGTVIRCEPDGPGAGAAGGTGFGLAAWGGRPTSGAAHVADLTGLTAAYADADLIITGEGLFDSTSLTGKLVGSVLSSCQRQSKRCIVIAGGFGAQPPAGSVSLTEIARSSDAARAEPLRWAQAAAAAAADAF